MITYKIIKYVNRLGNSGRENLLTAIQMDFRKSLYNGKITEDWRTKYFDQYQDLMEIIKPAVTTDKLSNLFDMAYYNTGVYPINVGHLIKLYLRE